MTTKPKRGPACRSAPFSMKTPNAKSEPTAPLLAQVGSTDGLGVAVPPAPTIDEEIGNG